ncbi:Predicted acetyltransferase [Pseudomonas putida]|uniref:GNAT family N-acetyltransferase n=1 Tax=Pseudomonas guariconensis TaxID=1288410 RepID=A0AAX0VQL9_9PSED|nr:MULTISPECIES: GNAT family N-acetyltransferase [Pseudomonas]CAB5535883.1 Predicted acetyltransferase [Pseudomonas putida]MDD2092970.1 GNAT family N-acetyltransferase [Pseudomonas guariconensis]MDM9593831.1 GNAT family N-acetyltransferase [Pseudomonas guariconensis]MDM9606658.1 GNAT family N-acetyltransferase [Pseudomonas guariconensis]MDM9611614.1 GNAT family N-acetyltransferase [Pseudomonas guariconensis]
MPDVTAASARVCLLDDGYHREVRSLLYHAYRHDPTLAYVFEAQRPGYERRLRMMLREWVRQHFYLQLPAIGLLVDDRLVGLALIAPSLRRLGVTDSWAWRLRMILGTGIRCTRRYLDYQAALSSALPPGRVHVLSLVGVHPRYQRQRYGEQLLQAVHDWCSEDPQSQGVVLNTGNAHFLAFYQRVGYQEVGEIAVGPIRERVFMRPNPMSVETAIG